MKKLTLVALAALLAASMAFAGWLRTYEDGIGYCVQPTSDGNYIASGESSGDEAWLMKVDTSGNVIWSKNFSSTMWLQGRWVEPTSDGGYILALRNLTLLKTDSNGDSLWAKDYNIRSHCSRQTSDGSYIVCGAVLGYPTLLALLKTDEQGDSLWMHTYIRDGWYASYGYWVSETDDKGYIATGLIWDTLYGQERYALWLIKTDSIGDTQWTYIQGGDNWGDWEDGRCVLQTSDSDYMVLARTGLLKVGNGGDSLWMQTYSDGSCLDETQNGGYILSGGVTQLATMKSNSTPLADMWLLNTDQNGDSLWRQGYGYGSLYHVRETSDKGFIVTGGTGKNGHVKLIKTDSLGLLGVFENPIVETDNGWNVPYSIGNYVVLHYQGLPQGFRANVFDVSGRIIDEIRGDGNEGAMTWGINQPPGVYFIQAMDNRNQLKTAKVVLVR